MIESIRAGSNRLTDAASFLATALLRLHLRTALAPAKSVAATLEVSDETVLSGPRGLTARDLEPRSER